LSAEIAICEEDLCPLPQLIFLAQYFGVGKTVILSHFVRFEVPMAVILIEQYCLLGCDTAISLNRYQCSQVTSFSHLPSSSFLSYRWRRQHIHSEHWYLSSKLHGVTYRIQ